MDKLHILDLSKLKIYKITRWSVYFKYDGQKYFLHESVDGYCTTLYKKDMKNSKYILEDLKILGIPIRVLIPHKERTQTYTSIRNEFVFRLTYYGFADGVYEELAHQKQEYTKMNKEKIRRLKADILEIEKINNNFDVDKNMRMFSQTGKY